jgi:radical SAM superfamily enzyme YgiQ (UPF0313 family)
MKILLVAPASGNWYRVGRSPLFSGKVFRFSLLSLLSVSAETPDNVDVEIIDEQVQCIPWNSRFDLVGITCMTAAAPRAYELARRFRRLGTPVVLGGMHPTFLPDEALRHADAVCVGEAEGTWSRIVEDARLGRLRGVYRGKPADLARLRPVPRGLLRARDYATVQAVQATRGCPNHCAFCAVSAFHEGRHRVRPVPDVIAEISALPRRFLVFTDDSLTADPGYARELFRAMRPLNRRWISQSTLSITEDPELPRLAAEAGCIGLFVGLETFTRASLDGVNKGFHRVDEYRDRVRLLHEHGIGVQAGIVFGFDRDDRGVFRRTLGILDDLEIDMIQVSILTPLPGTPWYQMMKERIIDRDWSHYDYHHVVFQPNLMSPAELQAGHDWVTHQFYRPWRIARRLSRMAARADRRALIHAATINAAYYGRTVRWGIRGWDPGAIRERGSCVEGVQFL